MDTPLMQQPIDHHTALIYTMVLVSAAEGVMADTEIETIGRLVRYLPVFRDFDHDRLTEVGEDCTYLLRQEDGLDLAIDKIAEALPTKLRETAYALACDIAAADGDLAEEELNLLHMLRSRLGVDSLIATAIERGAYARHARLA
jgi:tellurite resistance protein